jgi:hypothetical protein
VLRPSASTPRYQQFMKTYIAIIFLLFISSVYGQKYSDTTLSTWKLDSLLTVHNDLKGAFKKQGYWFRLQMETNKVDTTNFGQDSTFISYWTKEGKLLKRIEQLKSKGCVFIKTEKFYNVTGMIEYSETWNVSCGIAPKNNDPDIKIFSGMQTELERFEYDSLGRVIVRVWLYKSMIARRYSYSYDNNDQKHEGDQYPAK